MALAKLFKLIKKGDEIAFELKNFDAQLMGYY
jgi:hypothetical protein